MRTREPTSRVEPTTRQDGLPTLAITTPHREAEIHQHGATITHFQRTGDAPSLFLSQCSRFGAGEPIASI
ncbi:MAG: hypothetical protein MUE94_12980 [Verrucomicrobia bacterium]|jgi:D-hexose-6-phosphate mutarotase|nr:hypothetical protein [Verrucomicrobiota bacterium]